VFMALSEIVNGLQIKDIEAAYIRAVGQGAV
jgi:hypothetical protein